MNGEPPPLRRGTYNGPMSGTPLRLTVTLDGGLADRHQLPLDHVIKVLSEVNASIAAFGREVQAERGQDVTGDFGVEIVGGFKKGSFKATLAITKNVAVAYSAATRLINVVKDIGTKPDPKKHRRQLEADPRIVGHLTRLSAIQEKDKTTLKLDLTHGRRRSSAVFNERATQVIKNADVPRLQIDHVTLFGKLMELKDRSPEEEGGQYFLGELLLDDGCVWRVRFRSADAPRIAPLFRQQVRIEGRAVYSRLNRPRILATTVEADPDRDYEAAFDALIGCDRDVYDGQSLEDALRDMRGEN